MSDIDLSSIASMTEACERCFRLAGFEPKEVAYALGIEYAHFSRMMNPNDPRCFPPEKIVPLMKLCKNVLPAEWLAWNMGYALHDQGLTEILGKIRDALIEDGRPAFRICDGRRIERNNLAM